MGKIEVTYRIIVPMFLGGAEPVKKAELRVPSIKGALRFWYRAIYPKENFEIESRIFGGSGKGEGQARILLRLSDIRCPSQDAGDPRWHNSQVPYLGYGLISRQKSDEQYKGNPVRKFMTDRPYIKENSTFKLKILFKPPSRTTGEKMQQYEEDKIRVQKALWAMTMFGGLGARSRKGFGSLVAMETQGMSDLPTLQPADVKELQQGIRDFFGKIDNIDSTSLPEHTAFSADARCILIENTCSAMNSFKWLADKIHSLRSYRGSNKLPFVNEDHDDMRAFIENGTAPSKPPKRAAFGLPHNYFFSTIMQRKKGGVDFMDGNKKGRRASPLIFSIHEFGHKRSCVIATFLPARFIPAQDKILLSGACNDNGCLHKKNMPLPDDFSAVTSLLDALGGEEVRIK